MALASMSEIFERMARNGQEFWEVVLADDMDERQVSREASMAKMLTTWQAMQDAADSYTGRKRSVSGLVGGDGMKMRQYTFRGCAMTGGYVSEVIAEALSMAESNACMRRIVAAPTAGACGVLPAVLLPLCKYEELTQHQLLEALYVAAGIGVDHRLQGEHRGRVRRLSGGDRHGVRHGGGRARRPARRRGPSRSATRWRWRSKNLMGLVCDPVAGLVEVPCVKRNVIGAVNAVSAADMALAGIESRIPVDEVIDAMGEVGPAYAGRVPRNGARRSCRHADRRTAQARADGQTRKAMNRRKENAAMQYLLVGFTVWVITFFVIRHTHRK